MHPDRRFHAGDDTAALLAVAAAIGMAHIVVTTDEGPVVVHAPLTVHGTAIRFHVARGNRAARHLEGATALVSVMGPHGYVSPNWYERPGDQVPTWNYLAVEMTGTLRALDEAALIDQLDTLAATHEPLASPAAPWTRAKMNPAAFAALLRGIRGFELTIATLRGTRKLNQNKPDEDRRRVAEGLSAAGNAPLAAVMRAA